MKGIEKTISVRSSGVTIGTTGALLVGTGAVSWLVAAGLPKYASAYELIPEN